jgi:hypothetical protein
VKGNLPFGKPLCRLAWRGAVSRYLIAGHCTRKGDIVKLRSIACRNRIIAYVPAYLRAAPLHHPGQGYPCINLSKSGRWDDWMNRGVFQTAFCGPKDPVRLRATPGGPRHVAHAPRRIHWPSVQNPSPRGRRVIAFGSAGVMHLAPRPFEGELGEAGEISGRGAWISWEGSGGEPSGTIFGGLGEVRGSFAYLPEICRAPENAGDWVSLCPGRRL